MLQVFFSNIVEHGTNDQIRCWFVYNVQILVQHKGSGCSCSSASVNLRSIFWYYSSIIIHSNYLKCKYIIWCYLTIIWVISNQHCWLLWTRLDAMLNCKCYAKIGAVRRFLQLQCSISLINPVVYSSYSTILIQIYYLLLSDNHFS